MNSQEKKAAILDALLEHQGIEHVMSAASRVLDNPILMVSRMGTYAGFSSTEQYGDTYWERFNAAMPFDKVLDEVERKDLATRLMSSDDTIRERFGFFDRDVLGTRVRDRVDVLGYVSVVLENPLQEGDERILVALARMLAVEIVYQTKHASWRDEDSELIEGLLSGSFDADELPIISRSHGLDKVCELRLVCVCFEPSEEVSVFFAKAAIEMNVDALICGTYGSSVVLLVEDGPHCDALLDAVLRCSAGCTGIGLSNPFSSLDAFERAYGQAMDAVRLGRSLGHSGPVHDYATLIAYRFIEESLKCCDACDYVEPGVLRVVAYDKDHGTDLGETLRAFIESGRNMNACAKVLYTHRNTVHYRLKRILELLGIEFIDDELAFSIALSFRLLKMSTA